MRILTFSTLYPNGVHPSHGIFVATRLRKLREFADIEARVVAPVPWFPASSERFGRYAEYRAVPESETLHGTAVDHPRYLVIPKVGMTVAPILLAASVARVVRRLMRDGFDFDLIDAHYFYPDGVAAALLGKWLSKPVTITARGTDLNLIPRYRLARRQIKWAATRARGLITVCAALKEPLVEMGIAPDRVTVLRNGVDLEFFRPPLDREDLRKRLGMDGQVFLSVGHLIERKGHDLVIRALARFPEAKLIIAGAGPEQQSLAALVSSLSLDDRVTFIGSVSQDVLREYYGAADALILASSREGWANVLLESMACGTPVVATAIWGTPEVVAAPAAGTLAAERTVESIAAAIARLSAALPARDATRKYAEAFSWDATSAGLIQLFEKVVAGAPPG